VARLEQLIDAVENAALRREIEREIAALKDRTRFGLVYERHLPETALISDTDLVVPGALVRPKQEVDKEVAYRVISVKGKKARLVGDGNGKETQVPVADLFVVKPFGEPIYPTLTSVDRVERSADRPHHAVINGENFHTLQLLAYMYEGKVDCLYLDPPYNSGATDWKYNNSYVDRTDTYRHSKWLSFMEKRLRIAKRLLKPDGVLIITIDENEVHHLGVLLEDIFPEYLRYMITIVINPKGTAKVNFSRLEEYAIFLVPNTGTDVIAQLHPREEPAETDTVFPMDLEAAENGEEEADEPVDDAVEEPAIVDDVEYSVLYLRRRGAESSYREDRPKQFYAIHVDETSKTVVGVGPEVDEEEHPTNTRDGDVLAVYPIDGEGNERVWRYGRDTMGALIKSSEIRVGRYNQTLDTYTLNHWKPVPPEKVGLRRIRTVWWETRHDAGTHGTTLIANLLGRRKAFPFPKSLYAVRDCIEAAVKNRPDALIVDFFAGSGTTLHATCLLNAEDGGRRQCLLVTNNEVDPKTTRRLNRSGHFRGDPDFEAAGIFESATWPRVKAALTGLRPDRSPIPSGKKFEYIGGRPFADGFDENVEFFRLDYANPDAIELGQAFDAVHPALWLSAGACGPRPDKVDTTELFYVAPGYAVLFDVAALRDLERELAGRDDVQHVFVITESPEAYSEVRELIGQGRETTMLYRDYLRNFRINTPRDV
jgi:adenine-specific DNA-methyltransferase